MKAAIRLTLAAAALAVSGAAVAADATAWPTKPVQVIVPASPGGDTDFNARTMARFFTKITGKPMIVTNVSGGGGSVAMAQVRSAAPDGNTMLFAHTGMMIVNEVSGLIDYSFDAFDICCIPAVDKGVVFVSSKKSGLKDVAEVVAKVKAQPGTVIYGTELGGFSHLQGLMFQSKAGVQLKIVDTGPAADKITNLLGGRIDLASITYGAVKDYQSTGDMNMVAQFNDKPNPLIPSVKTFKEQGMAFQMEKPYIIAFPKGTDPAIVRKMADVMKQITQDPAYAKALEEGFKQPVTFYGTKEAIELLNGVRTEFMQYKDLLRQKK
jgi:tripartite-type tricarboxylate transporter receptor subunit TctC